MVEIRNDYYSGIVRINALRRCFSRVSPTDFSGLRHEFNEINKVVGKSEIKTGGMGVGVSSNNSNILENLDKPFFFVQNIHSLFFFVQNLDRILLFVQIFE